MDQLNPLLHEDAFGIPVGGYRLTDATKVFSYTPKRMAFKSKSRPTQTSHLVGVIWLMVLAVGPLAGTVKV